MVNKGVVSFVSCLAACQFAFAGEHIPLWPEKIPDFQPHQIGATTEEAKCPDQGTNIFVRSRHQMPYLEWFEMPKKGNGACMIIISGGGYNCCCDNPSFRPLVQQLIANGICCVNLTYRTPRPIKLPIYQSAWEDGQRAVRLVRSMAKERGFDPERIGVMGCSAGSHLSVLLGTSSLTPAYKPVDEIDAIPCHINWAIPMCPAYALTDGLEGPNKNGGNGEGVKLNPCFKFDAKTCPMCFFHGGKDPYSPIGSTMIYRELRKRKIPAELHLDADRAHGPVNVKKFERALEFMRQMGFLGKLEREQQQDHRFMPNWTLRTEKEILWPEGKMPDANSAHHYAPYLIWYIPEKITTKAIQIVFAGGGYGFCNINGEATPVAHYLNSKGMTAVSVMYRCPRPQGKEKHFSAWQDAQRAIRMVRSEAVGRCLDPDKIGIMGFSAGGHLTLMTAVNARTSAYSPIDAIDKVSCDVQWAFPIYPAYVLTDGTDNCNTDGGNLDVDVIVKELTFDEATPSMCLIHGDADGYSSMASVKVWEKLRRIGRQSDLHTLAKRGHCFQMNASPKTGSYTWMDRLWEFLDAKKLK